MKTNRAHDAFNYAFIKGEVILIDANIWLYLNPPPINATQSWEIKSYSAIYYNLLRAGAIPAMEALVGSEYVNRYARLEYNAIYKKNFPDYKLFRSSADGLALLRKIASEVTQITKSAARKDTSFEMIDLSDVLAEFSAGNLDFNDGVIAETCRLNGWRLLTHDADMTKGGIEVITANKKLLHSCPL